MSGDAWSSFAAGPLERTPLRAAITAAGQWSESTAVARLLAQPEGVPQDTPAVQALARQLVTAVRARQQAHRGTGLGRVQALLQEYALSSQEGVALMCLAEALLRIPDAATRDALIRDQLRHGQWAAHLGHSPSWFVNAATWGLVLTGGLMAVPDEAEGRERLLALLRRGGEPWIRMSMDLVMRLMGEQFVCGVSIEQALARARPREARGYRYSFDMLGEAALTHDDAQRYRSAYEAALHAIGQTHSGQGVYAGAGLSIKLSALHPRYQRSQYRRVMDELYPALRHLAVLARSYEVGLNLDAEEAERLELSLDLFERLCGEPALQGFEGLGFVVQAYQKRAPAVIEHLIDLAQRSRHRLMVRLVKGAYWDSEIKRAQVEGLADYPVYTRKAHTDLAYLTCARQLLAAPKQIYPQFATHNAQTLAAIYHLAGPQTYAPGQYEFQCLHGMGEALYDAVIGPPAEGGLGRSCRIYAPVGAHATLLPYLVRRLLENGANSSFVNRLADPRVALETLLAHPVETVRRQAEQDGEIGRPHPAIPLPQALYGAQRVNSQGLDLNDERDLVALQSHLRDSARHTWTAHPMLAEGAPVSAEPAQPIRNPADHRDTVGEVQHATQADVDLALAAAEAMAPAWARTPPGERAKRLALAADLLQARLGVLVGLLIREAGKTAASAVAEVREAIDFLRYDSAQLRQTFGEAGHEPLGPVVCISPWNFPLAIFVGQVAAALAAGNTVLAKPAEQTPLIAAEAVRLLWQAGVPRAAVQLLPGPGESIGETLVRDARVQGVAFTGSHAVARRLQQMLADRLDAEGQPVTLIAETGGLNAMLVDASALPEQVVRDALSSAFDSAGQRCSALRILCLQEAIAEPVLSLLRGAMAELRMGRPSELAVDLGPVIDADARDRIERHVSALQQRGRRVVRACRSSHEDTAMGTFVPPTLIELDHLGELQQEVFGPVLHVVRYARRDLPALLAAIHATGYGLTLGLHTRIDDTIAQVGAQARVGNLYVNRNMIGAVVGVQPFGGEGCSGTGPKAGGPLYLDRLLRHPPADALPQALAFAGEEVASPWERSGASLALKGLRDWAAHTGRPGLAEDCREQAARAHATRAWALRGPTGERNIYRLVPRRACLIAAEREDDRLRLLVAALAVGCRAVWRGPPPPGWAQWPDEVREVVQILADGGEPAVDLDVALHQGSAASLLALCRALAQRPGPIVSVVHLPENARAVPLVRLLVERTVSLNTAAAGGNAALLTLP